MPVIRFEDAPRTENVQGRHVRHCSRALGSAEILMGRTTKHPGPCAPYIHKHDHEAATHGAVQGAGTVASGSKSPSAVPRRQPPLSLLNESVRSPGAGERAGRR